MKSLGTKIQQCEGLLGTKDVNEWQDNFLRNMLDLTNGGADTTRLSPKQAAIVEQIYERHFA